jgi:hypothetical protein
MKEDSLDGGWISAGRQASLAPEAGKISKLVVMFAVGRRVAATEQYLVWESSMACSTARGCRFVEWKAK